MAEGFQCQRHAFWITPENRAGCPDCLAEATHGPDPAGMTGEARAAEVSRWLFENMTIPMDPIWERITALVGRSVYNHELGLRAEALVEEARARTGEVPEQEIVESLVATGKPVVILRQQP